jgi:hypothetical protein
VTVYSAAVATKSEAKDAARARFAAVGLDYRE